MIQQITIPIDVPEGWEFVRYGNPNEGEYFLGSGNKRIELALFDFDEIGRKYFIFRKIQKPQPIWPECLRDGVELKKDVIHGWGMFLDGAYCELSFFNRLVTEENKIIIPPELDAVDFKDSMRVKGSK